jgi:hypothetical protein
MAYVSIPKDLTRIKTKFLFGLTKRQVLCFGAGAGIGVPLFFLTKLFLPVSMAAFMMVIIMLPCFLLAMYEKNGQPLEKVAKQIITTRFTCPKKRIYQTDNLYAAAERQYKLNKEVQAIVTGEKTRSGGSPDKRDKEKE